MKLTAEQQKKIIEKLQRPGWGNICKVCNGSNWNISDTIFELREFQGGNLVVGGAIYPVIPMNCSGCGNTNFLNAIVAGVLEPQAKEGAKSE